MGLLFLVITVGMLWLSMIALALAVFPWVKEYAVARVGSILVLCLILFFLEHFIGLGKNLPLLVLSLPLTAWLLWQRRAVVREHWEVEAFFAVGFLYALLWRCTFPDIDAGADRLSDLVIIQAYMVGESLPAMDRWLPPFDLGFHHGFQHYAAGLMGRWLRINPEMSFHFGFCALAGLVTCAAGTATRQFCAWRPAAWLIVLVMLIGGKGMGVGKWMAYLLAIDKEGGERAMEAFSQMLVSGQYHPPLTGILLLAFAALLMGAQEAGAVGRQRALHHGLLAATVPMGMIGNAWIVPLQVVLVVGWLIYRSWSGERNHWLAAGAGGAIALGLCSPHLIAFVFRETGMAPWEVVRSDERTSFWHWILNFWPVIVLLMLSAMSRGRSGLVLFFALVWVGMLGLTELVFIDDGPAGLWDRSHSIDNWWPWISTGILLTVGARNLGSPSKICRWGTVCVLLVLCSQGWDMARIYLETPKPSAMRLEGSHWIAGVPATKNLVQALRIRPDGIALESGHPRDNPEVTALSTFGHKISFVGWSEQEAQWRNSSPVVGKRLEETQAFYKNELPDALEWLITNDIRYVLFLQRDNGDDRFTILRDKIKEHYSWYATYGNDRDWAIGFFERREK